MWCCGFWWPGCVNWVGKVAVVKDEDERLSGPPVVREENSAASSQNLRVLHTAAACLRSQ